jgi:hypothetical protein
MANRPASIVVVLTLLYVTGFLARVGARPNPQASPTRSPVPAANPSATLCAKPMAPAKREHAYHNGPPTSPLPPTMDPRGFADNKAAFVAYSIAAKIPDLLYQEPCYCPCDKLQGHESLLDCFVGDHGKVCIGCQMEAIFVYEQSKLGKTVVEIRTAMEKHDFKKVDLDKYVETHHAEYKQQMP